MSRRWETPQDPRTTDGNRRRTLERLWFGLVMAWSGCRIAAVWEWLDRYGVHPLVYALVEFGSSVPYAIGSAKTIGAIVDRRYRRAAVWGLVAAVCFAAPDVFILSTGRDLPLLAYSIVIGVALVAGTWAVLAGRRDVVIGVRTGGRTSARVSEPGWRSR